MSEVKTKSGYHHGDLRQQLVSATRSLVEQKGPDLFSVSEACRAAGVSTAAPYRHFSDRTEMLVAVAIEGFEEMSAAFASAAGGHPPGSNEAFTELGIAYVQYAEANPGLFRMMFGGEYHTDTLEASGQVCYAFVLGQMAARLGKAEIDDEVFQAAFPLWTFVHGLAFLRIDGKAEFAKARTDVREMVSMATLRLLSPVD